MDRFAPVKIVTIVANLPGIATADLCGQDCAADPNDCNGNGEPDACELGGGVGQRQPPQTAFVAATLV